MSGHGFIFSAFLAAFTASAQTGGTGTVKPTNPATTPTPAPRTSTSSNDTNQLRTVFISGKVIMEDGAPPPESVVIERSCGASRRAETHTDLKGHFSFQIGGGSTNTDAIMDVSNDSVSSQMPGGSSGGALNASQSGVGSGRLESGNNLRGCELRAALPGYKSSSVNLSMRSQFDSPDIGIIVLKRLGGRDGDTISVTNALAPKDAKKAFDRARLLLAKGNAAESQKELLKAVELYPKYAAAWAELGRLQMDAKDDGAARKSFEQSLQADPKYLPPYERLAVLALRERNWDELVDKTDKLIKLNAYDYPQAYYYNALANLNLNHWQLAETSARKALQQDPLKFARAYYVLGLALAQKGDFAAAAEQLKSYLLAGPAPSEIAVLKEHLADIEKRAAQ